MPVNLSGLSALTTNATALSNLILVTPQSVVGYAPQNPPNADGTVSTAPRPPSLLFNYEGEQTISIESDITDHYVEDNTAVQDQIALKPEIVTTHGFIGELNNVPPSGLKLVKQAADKLTTIGTYVPQLSITALIAYNEALLLYQVAANAANAAVSAWSSVGNALSGSNGQAVIGSSGLIPAKNQNKQQTAFQQFYGYWRSRTLFTVQTPWAVLQNMAIFKLRAIQDAESDTVTDFEISFKAIRTAQTISTPGGILTSFNGRSGAQANPLTSLGTSSPTSSIPLSGGLSTMGVA